jgi:hypothetical protein
VVVALAASWLAFRTPCHDGQDRRDLKVPVVEVVRAQSPSADFHMASADLSVHASRQRYTFVRAEGAGAVVRCESLDGDFKADITYPDS